MLAAAGTYVADSYDRAYQTWLGTALEAVITSNVVDQELKAARGRYMNPQNQECVRRRTTPLAC